ncbi:EAL domain-containing protein [Candidatus Marinarcus aquaticus]|uniref:EAL domain-containing protein n=1 Tax=Candidatus Marinarcus aquaticus TaxID=2044504 RepID=UPI0013E91967|nr:EAL domain-containing protein [Candidatus Marinarcus aquaticus]
MNNLILNAPYQTKYEAILDVTSKDIVAYEALAKFGINQNIISTEKIFQYLHHNNELFYSLEQRNKAHQLEHAPQSYPVFVNFDADIVVSDEQKNHWEMFLKEHQKSIVVEITENGSDDEKSANIMRNFSSWLKQREIKTALDDFAQDGSMFSFFIMNNSSYIKIDKSFLRQIERNENYFYYLEGVIKTIQANGQKSIVEGVETKEDYETVKKLGSNYMQGYYFSDLTKTV